jgi:hypothetical protein
MIASPTIGVDYVAGKFGRRKMRATRLVFAVRQRRRQTNELAETATKLCWSRLVRRLRVPYVIKKTYAPDAAGSVV